MKTLLFLLLIPIMSFGQQTERLTITDNVDKAIGSPSPANRLSFNLDTTPAPKTIGAERRQAQREMKSFGPISPVTCSGEMRILVPTPSDQKDQEFKTTLSKMWRQYKLECYNDSTFATRERIELGNGRRFVYPANKWIHRQPTFDGFMEWMERRGL